MIVGIGHERNVGKDIAAQILATQLKVLYPAKVIDHVAFADPIYKICHRLYGWAGQRSKRYYDDHKEEKEIPLPLIGKSPRELLIGMGMAGRHTHDSTWLDYTLNREADVQFISDVRFPNEAEAIRERRGILIKVVREGLPPVTDPNDPDNQLRDWDDWDFVIDNNGTLQEYAGKVRGLINEIAFW